MEKRISPPNIMNEGITIPEPKMACLTDKRGLANRYMVGKRTIESWLGDKIIRGIRRGKRIFFDAEECDRRLQQFSNHKEIYGNN